MFLKNQLIGAIVAAALVASPAYAVEGSDGMHYTSASEGFYASIRLRFNSTGGTKNSTAVIEHSSSRLGVQGTSEMSHGLEGFYRYESAFSTDNGGGGFNTRLAYVGLRGGFGSFRVGSDWADTYNWVTGATDIANTGGGNFTYGNDFVGRADRSIHYQSPDFNGLQVAARFEFDGGADSESKCRGVAPSGTPVAGMTVTYNPDDGACNSDHDSNPLTGGLLNPEKFSEKTNDSELDSWALAAKYSFAGFRVSGMYQNRPDFDTVENSMGQTTGVEDLTSWAVGASYGQDNWSMATWYGENNASDFGEKQDESIFSVAGNVTIGKSGVYVIHENKEDSVGDDDSYTVFGVEYRFNSKAKTWIEYNNASLDSSTDEDDRISIGLRHDF